MAGTIPPKTINIPTAIAKLRAPWTGPSNKRLAVHYCIKPWNGNPGDLAYPVGNSLKSCAFVIIRAHFKSECDKRSGINCIGTKEKT